MAQTTSGIRSILSVPGAYTLLQTLLGADRVRRRLARDYIRARGDDVVLDVGCGPAMILDFLPATIRYYGFDLSPDYIAAAQARYGDRGHFICADIATAPADSLPPCTLALALGLLHHLDDAACRHLLQALHQRLAPGGRVITFDGAFVEGQSYLARKLVAADRGRNVRTPAQYAALVPAGFDVETVVTNDLLYVPYTHCILVLTKDGRPQASTALSNREGA